MPSFLNMVLLHFYQSGFLVLNDNKWRIWRSKVIWFLRELWSVINMLPGFISSQQHQGSYTVIALLLPLWKQEKVRNWQPCCFHLGGAVPDITHWPKPAAQWGEHLGRALTVNIQQTSSNKWQTLNKWKSYLVQWNRRYFCVENSYLLQIWPSILCVHVPIRNCV